MTATDELRRLLDERGVEWDELVGHPVVVGTEWHDRYGCPCTALEHADDVPDGMLSVQANLTPEQAIEATLGSDLKAENEKLRTLLGGGSIVTDYWKDEDGTMHVLTTDGEHTYEYMRGGLADENAKLRELVRDMWNGMCGYAHDCRSCEHYELYEGQRLVGECQYHARMRELGVEV